MARDNVKEQSLSNVEETLQPKAQHQEEGGEAVDKGREDIDQRAAMLLQQAEAIMQASGLNMIEMFQQDELIHDKVLSGEWDFSIAYGFVLGRESAKKGARKSVPAVVKAPNHANTRKSVAAMSDREFDELDERLSRGEVFDPSR